MTQVKTYAYRDIVDLTFWLKEIKTGRYKPVLIYEYLKSLSVEGTGNMVPAKGGRGNPTLATFYGDREVTITGESAVLSPKMYSMQFGTPLQEITENNKETIDEQFSIEIPQGATGDELSFELEHISKHPDRILIYLSSDGSHLGQELANKGNEDPTEKNEFKVINDTSLGVTNITLHEDLTKDQMVNLVVFYEREVSRGVIMTLDSDKYSSCKYRVTGRTFWSSTGDDANCEGDKVPVQLIFHQLKLSPNFSIPSAADGDPVTQNLDMTLLKPQKRKEMMRIVQYAG